MKDHDDDIYFGEGCTCHMHPPCDYCIEKSKFEERRERETEKLRVKHEAEQAQLKSDGIMFLLTDEELDFEYAKLRHFQYVTELYAEAIESIMGSVYNSRQKLNLL